MNNWNSIVVSLLCGRYENRQANGNNCKNYRTFGNHDLVTITAAQGSSSNKKLKDMLQITHDYSQDIKAGESIHNLFATTDNCDSFWENESPYLFISAIQINFDNNNTFENQLDSFKVELNKFLSEKEFLFNENFTIYNSLDCGDVLLFLKTDSYIQGADIINEITTKLTKRHYSYSLCAFNENLLSKKLEEDDEIIPKAVVCSVLSDASNYGRWFGEFCVEYPNEFMCRNCEDCDKNSCESKRNCERLFDEYIHLARLGNEDICINIFNCRLKHFFEMLSSDKGIFSYKNPLVRSTFSRLRIQFDSEVRDVTSLTKLSTQMNNKTLIGQYSDVWKPILKLYATPYVYKAISEVLAAIENLELRKFAFDVQDCIRNVFPLFINKITHFCNNDTDFSLKKFNEHLIWFTTGILSIANSTLHADKLFINVPGFNAVPCDAPSKLLAYYTAYIQKLVEILNDSKDFDYRFLLCPDLYLGIEVEKLFNYNENDSQLLKARIPIGKLFDPQDLLMELSHEAAHFVGTKIRKRKKRASTLTTIISYKFADMLLRAKEFECSRENMEAEKKEILVLTSLSSKLNNEATFDELLRDCWSDIPKYIKTKLDIGFKDIDILYLDVVNQQLKDTALSLFVNDSIGELQDKVCNVIITEDIDGNKTDDMFYLSSLLNRHINELLLGVYTELIDDCCSLCSESFADMIMLTITDDPQTYLYKIFEAEKDMSFEVEGKAVYPWNYPQFKVNKYERILSVFSAFEYKLDDIECNDDSLFMDFIQSLKNYTNPQDDKYQISSIVAIEENAQYLAECLSELECQKEELDKLKKLYNSTLSSNLNGFINSFREANFEFRDDIVKFNKLV